MADESSGALVTADDVAAFDQKLAAWALTLEERECCVLWALVACALRDAPVVDEPAEVQGYDNFFDSDPQPGTLPPSPFSLPQTLSVLSSSSLFPAPSMPPLFRR
jgi:hypothetical protein